MVPRRALGGEPTLASVGATDSGPSGQWQLTRCTPILMGVPAFGSVPRVDWEADEIGADLPQAGCGRGVVGELVGVPGLAVGSLATRRTSVCDDMAATKTSTAGLPDSRAIAAAARWALARSRPVMPTLAPMEARPIAAALPIPPVPPVISTVLPCIEYVVRLIPVPALGSSEDGRP